MLKHVKSKRHRNLSFGEPTVHGRALAESSAPARMSQASNVAASFQNSTRMDPEEFVGEERLKNRERSRLRLSIYVGEAARLR